MVQSRVSLQTKIRKVTSSKEFHNKHSKVSKIYIEPITLFADGMHK